MQLISLHLNAGRLQHVEGGLWTLYTRLKSQLCLLSVIHTQRASQPRLLNSSETQNMHHMDCMGLFGAGSDLR